MKRIISLILALGIISSNLTTVFAQDAASALHNRMKLYEIWPGLFAEDINNYVAKSEQYLLAKPSASQAELDAMTKSLRESENLINKVLKANLANDDFIYDLYNSLAIADNRYSSKSRFSLMYTKNAVNALSSGQTPRSAATVLKDTPDFFNKIAKDILDKSSVDFEFLVNKIQRTFNLPRVKAVSLALSAEIQYAQSLLGGRIAALRGRIARNKVLIRKAGARADRQVTAWRREISNAQKELLDLKRIYDDPFRTLLYSVGDEGIDNIVAIAKQTNKAEISMIPGLAQRVSKAELTSKTKMGLKSLKSVLPLAIGAGLFLTLYTSQANAANTSNSELAIINAVSNRTELKREILTAVQNNPDNIGIIYTGGKEVRNMVSELFQSESENSLSAEKLLPYIEDWGDRIHTLATNEEALKAYLSDIKAITTEMEKEEFNERIQRDLVIPQDNTAVHKNIPFELMRFQPK